MNRKAMIGYLRLGTVGIFLLIILLILASSPTTMATASTSSATTNLAIYDKTDPEGGSNTIYEYNSISFYANYSNVTSGAELSGASCNITLNVSGGWVYENMTYQAGIRLFEYNRTFDTSGTFNWNVTCDITDYDTLTINDTFTITHDSTSPAIKNITMKNAIGNTTWWVSKGSSTTITAIIYDAHSGINSTGSGTLTDLSQLTGGPSGYNTAPDSCLPGPGTGNYTCTWTATSSSSLTNGSTPSVAVSPKDNAANTGTAGFSYDYGITYVDTDMPSAVTDLSLSNTATGQVALSWTAASDSGSGIARQLIYRKVTGASYANIYNATSAATGYADTSAAHDTNYAYKVQAVDKAGNEQGTGNSEPTIIVNMAPTIDVANATTAQTGVLSESANPTANNSWVNFTVEHSDVDATDTHIIYICKANDGTASGCGASGQWCNSPSYSAANPLGCIYTITPADTGGSKNWYAYVVDNSSGSGVSSYTSGTFEINRPPATGTPTLSPANVFESSVQINCTNATTTDSDGDAVTFTYSWFNDAGVIAGQTSSYLSNSSYAHFDNITCEIKPTDGHSYAGSAVNSSSVQILNTVPTVASATIVPATAYETSVLNCTNGTVSDDDGDTATLSYKWFNDAGVISGQTAWNLTGTYFNHFDNITCEITPNDGIANGSALNSSAITIQNSVPTISGESLNRSSVNTNETVKLYFVITDVDGESDIIDCSAFIGGDQPALNRSGTLDTAYGDSTQANCTVTYTVAELGDYSLQPKASDSGGNVTGTAQSGVRVDSSIGSSVQIETPSFTADAQTTVLNFTRYVTLNNTNSSNTWAYNLTDTLPSGVDFWAVHEGSGCSGTLITSGSGISVSWEADESAGQATGETICYNYTDDLKFNRESWADQAEVTNTEASQNFSSTMNWETVTVGEAFIFSYDVSGTVTGATSCNCSQTNIAGNGWAGALATCKGDWIDAVQKTYQQNTSGTQSLARIDFNGTASWTSTANLPATVAFDYDLSSASISGCSGSAWISGQTGSVTGLTASGTETKPMQAYADCFTIYDSQSYTQNTSAAKNFTIIFFSQNTYTLTENWSGGGIIVDWDLSADSIAADVGGTCSDDAWVTDSGNDLTVSGTQTVFIEASADCIVDP
ncbi:MAG: fibronectin type III domain-containing protein, partial [Candidatus Aenigmarchaeota archaeon]|nr:fibronectin type III domain-containing protein [Candidatus Aenigmarchaeota archaeon]